MLNNHRLLHNPASFRNKKEGVGQDDRYVNRTSELDREVASIPERRKQETIMIPDDRKLSEMGPESHRREPAGRVAFEEDELVSVKWIADRTRLSRITIRRHLDAAGIRPIRFGSARNATIRYRRSDVERWLRSCWIT